VVTRAKGSSARTVVRVSAELLMTIAVILALFVVYHLWWTGFMSAQAADGARQELEQSWEVPPPRPSVVDDTGSPTPSLSPSPTSSTPAPASSSAEPAPVSAALGDAFGMIYMPRLKDKVWGLPLIHGIDDRSLARGIGYFPGTAAPGQLGNFALAGHRATNGEPLRDIDRLQDGDLVIVRTREAWFTYRLDRDLIVQPSDIWVIDRNPFAAEGAQLDRRLTIVTCHPRWGSSQRWIWWGTLTNVRSAEDGPPPGLGL
jgi:sortase A